MNAANESAPETPGTEAVAPTILIVEDDSGIARLLADILKDGGFSHRLATNGREMDAELARGRVDLILLDIMLPGETGQSICNRLRYTSKIPIIMVTALGEEVDRVLGLELGADDYLTKPFSSRELVARIRAVLRRTQGEAAVIAPAAREYRFGDWRVSVGERQLFGRNGARITLTSAEFDLLLALCENPGRPLGREELLELTRSGLAGPTDRTIDVHVSRIRQKIEPDPRNPILIKTVRLGGYQLTPTVERL